jgi:hypothetical protein
MFFAVFRAKPLSADSLQRCNPASYGEFIEKIRENKGFHPAVWLQGEGFLRPQAVAAVSA